MKWKEWNGPKIVKDLQDSFAETMDGLGNHLTYQFTIPDYEWPRGESPRDIVDTGHLRDSQQGPFIDGLSATFIWPVEYAIYVHEGAVLSNGTVLPARPWATRALQTFNAVQVLSTVFQARASQ